MKILKIIANIRNPADNASLLRHGNLQLLTKLTNFRKFLVAAGASGVLIAPTATERASPLCGGRG